MTEGSLSSRPQPAAATLLRHWRAAFASVLLLLPFAARAQAQMTAPGSVTTIRLGYMTFDPPGKLPSDPNYRAIRDYLQAVSERSRSRDGSFKRPVEFDIVTGNHYQIFAWLKSGDIDGAVCSAFILLLLEERGGVTPIVEFVRTANDPGYRAVIEGPQYSAAAYDADLNRIMEGQAPPLEMVAHLSSSGFIAPLMHADRFLRQRGPLSDAKANSFWHRLLGNVHFRLRHGERSSFTFERPERVAPQEPYALQRSTSGDQALAIPPDALVLRAAVAEAVFDARGPSGSDAWVMRFANKPPPDSLYQLVRPLVAEPRRAFSARVEDLRSWEALDRRFRAWFEEDKFDFTVDESIQFLRNDAADTGREDLALVLSGGGVKGAYQSRLLDYLYGDYLVNAGARSSTQPQGTLPLAVQHVVGTSGGAIVGLFAAQVTPGDKSPLKLAEHWVREKRAVASADQIFAQWDLMRWVSFWVVLFVLASCLVFRRALRREAEAPAGRLKPLPALPSAAIVLAILVAPIGLSVAMSRRESTLLIEGLMYVLVLLGAHAAWNCCFGAPSGAEPSSGRGHAWPTLLTLLGWSGLFAGSSWMVLVLFTSSHSGDYGRVSLPSILVLAGLLLLLASLLSRAALGLSGLRLVDAALHARAVSAALAFCVLAYGASRAESIVTGYSTSLELTLAYWMVLIAIGASLAIAVGLAFARWPSLPLGGLVAYLVTPRGVRGPRVAPLISLIIVLGIGIGMWTTFVSSALYGNDTARAFLARRLHDTIKERRVEGVALQTDLLIATSALVNPEIRTEKAGPDGDPTSSSRRVPASACFFCFPHDGNCATFGGQNAFVVPGASVEHFLSVVFASGSPFPIFPARRVDVPILDRRPSKDRTERLFFRGDLVDGGYAHQEALEAAAMSGARQVLVVRASPIETDASPGWSDKLFSRLARHLPRIFSFMFAQSQELDRSIGRNLVVATLTPHEENPPFPFLMDFRPAQVELVDRAASQDLSLRRRIGRIEGWGRPQTFDTVRAVAPADELPLPSRGWATDTRAALVTRLSGRSADRRVAIFDLDNTCIRGDIGEAVFRAQVESMTDHPDDPAFWALFDPDLKARHDAAASEQKAEVLRKVFHEQYQRLLEAPNGTGVAYAWLTLTLGGRTPAQIQTLTATVLKREADRPDGIRIHGEIRDLVAGLTRLGWEIWIVSASNEHSVRVVARALGVREEHVVGVRLRADQSSGKLGYDLAEPIPYGPGKVEALQRLQLTPRLVVGDSAGDREMLLASTGVALLIDHGNKVLDPETMPSQAPTWIVQPSELLTPEAVEGN